MADSVEGGEGGVVGGGQGVNVFAGGGDGSVAEAFADGFQVGASGEEPGGVGVAPVRLPPRLKDFIYDQVRDGRLRAIRIARQLRFHPPDVDAFVDANTVTDPDL